MVLWCFTTVSWYLVYQEMALFILISWAKNGKEIIHIKKNKCPLSCQVL